VLLHQQAFGAVADEPLKSARAGAEEIRGLIQATEWQRGMRPE
jgi:hypothetical protein